MPIKESACADHLLSAQALSSELRCHSVYGDILCSTVEQSTADNILNMTLEEFSNKINMSGSNLGNIETGKIGLTERVLSDICRTFHVSRTWITEGAEPVFEKDSDPLDMEISRLYSLLSDDNKKYLYGYMQRLLEEQS